MALVNCLSDPWHTFELFKGATINGHNGNHNNVKVAVIRVAAIEFVQLDFTESKTFLYYHDTEETHDFDCVLGAPESQSARVGGYT